MNKIETITKRLTGIIDDMEEIEELPEEGSPNFGQIAKNADLALSRALDDLQDLLGLALSEPNVITGVQIHATDQVVVQLKLNGSFSMHITALPQLMNSLGVDNPDELVGTPVYIKRHGDKVARVEPRHD